MSTWNFEDLDVIAVLERDPPVNSWRMLDTVFCLRAKPEEVIWPERIADWLPSGTLTLKLSIESPGRHRVQLLR